eukprot:TRINITY_DN1918_c1_g1_i1.p1 TRINITY_DN1918_c1_g1~~TRINITY_DN1918_c1_g1_i1.p1  ORF type:complete len:1123 (+),score=522.44 TRINITY_DN1918_c1_g1_i1:76-3369(+)
MASAGSSQDPRGFAAVPRQSAPHSDHRGSDRASFYSIGERSQERGGYGARAPDRPASRSSQGSHLVGDGMSSAHLFTADGSAPPPSRHYAHQPRSDDGVSTDGRSDAQLGRHTQPQYGRDYLRGSRRSDERGGGRRSSDHQGAARDAERLENLVEMLRQDVDDAQLEIRALRQQNAELRSERTKQALSPGGRFAQYDERERQLREVEDKLRESHGLNEALQDDCDGLELALEKTRRAEEVAQQEAACAREEVARIRRVLREQDEELRAARAQLDSKRDTIREMEEMLRGKEADIHQLGVRSRHTVSEQEEQVGLREIRIKRLEDELQRKEAELQEGQEAAALLRQFVKEKDITIDLLKSRCQEDLGRQAVILRQRAADQEGDHQLLERRCEAFELERENLTYEIENLRRALGQMKDLRHREREELQALSAHSVQSVREELQEQLDEQLLQIGKLQQERDCLVSERERELAKREAEWQARNEAEAARHEAAEAQLLEQLEDQRAASERMRREFSEAEEEWERRLNEKDDALGSAAEQLREAEDYDRERERRCELAEAAAQSAERRELDAEQARREMVAELGQVSGDLSDARERISALEEAEARWRRSEGELRSECEQREQAVEDLGRELETRERRLGELERELDDARVRARDREAELARYKQELDQALAIGDELQKTADIVHATNRRREETLKGRELDFRKQGDRIKAQEGQLQDLRNRNAFLEREVADRDAQLKELEAMVEEQQRIADGERKDLFDRERRQREEASKCQSEVQAAHRARGEAREDAERAREELYESERIIAELRRVLQERDDEAAELRQRTQQLLAQVDGSEERGARERREAKLLKQTVQQLQQQLEDAERQTSESTAKATCSRARIEDELGLAERALEEFRRVYAERLSGAGESAEDFARMDLWQLSRELPRRLGALQQGALQGRAGEAQLRDRAAVAELWLEALGPEAARAVDAVEAAASDEEDEGDMEAHRWREAMRRMRGAAQLLDELPPLRRRCAALEEEAELARAAAASWQSAGSRRSLTSAGGGAAAGGRRASGRGAPGAGGAGRGPQASRRSSSASAQAAAPAPAAGRRAPAAAAPRRK